MPNSPTTIAILRRQSLTLTQAIAVLQDAGCTIKPALCADALWVLDPSKRNRNPVSGELCSFARIITLATAKLGS